MSEIRLAFVGAGSMGQAAHLRNYATLPGCRLVSLAEKRPDLGAKVARRFGVDKLYDGFEQMLENEEIDGIVAIQQFEMHATYVPQLLKKGVPLLTEKPLAATYEDGETILNAVRTTGTPLFLAYHKRSDPAVTSALQTTRNWTASGEAGNIRYIRVTMPPGDWTMQAFASNLQTDEKFDSGLPAGGWDAYATFVNYYVHQVNLIRFLLGENYRVLYADPAGITMTLQSDSGVIAVLEMAPYTTRLGWQESVLICFEKGWIKIDLPAPLAIDQPGQVHVYLNDTLTSPTLKPWHAMRCQAANFLAAIRGEPHPLCSAEDALKDLDVASQYMAKMSASGSPGKADQTSM